MRYSRVVALLSALLLLVVGAGIARADQVRGDGDSLTAGLQSGNPAAVSLAPGASHTFKVAVQVVSTGGASSPHVSFPVGIAITTTGGILGAPAPTAGNVTAYGTAGQLPVQVTATAPAAAELTCGVTNSLSGKVIFDATTDIAELGANGTNAEIVLAINVAGRSCPEPPPSDTTPPTITWDAPSETPWYSSPPTASWTCSDAESAATGSGSATARTDGTITATCSSAGGTTTETKTYKVDPSPPVLTWTSAAPSGWYASTQTATWTCTDAESGTTTSGGSAQTDDDGDVTASCENNAGLTSSDSRHYQIDTTPPTLTWTSAAPSRWYNTPQTATWTCSDDESGATGSGSGTTEGEGAGLTITATCTNGAGTETSGSRSYDVDLTSPLVSLLGGPGNGGSYYYGDLLTAPTCDASDLLSGLAGDCSVTGFSTQVGTHSVTASATDNAGNTGSTSDPYTYTVNAWTLGGFYRPVDMNEVVNTVKAGSTVPLKFNVWAGPTEKKELTAIRSHGAKQITCGTLGDQLDPLEYTATGATSLRYDTTGSQFIYNWQTPKSPGTCWITTVVTQDGSKISAYFRLK